MAADVVRNIVGHAGVVGGVHRHSTLEPVVVAVVNLWVCMHTQLRTERLAVSAALRGGARPARKRQRTMQARGSGVREQSSATYNVAVGLGRCLVEVRAVPERSKHETEHETNE
jgi:hypothetical protein